MAGRPAETGTLGGLALFSPPGTDLTSGSGFDYSRSELLGFREILTIVVPRRRTRCRWPGRASDLRRIEGRAVLRDSAIVCSFTLTSSIDF